MKINIFWFRRDLRLHDNAGLYRALKSEYPVLPIFIFDRNILDELPQKDARVEFIHGVIHELNDKLGAEGSSIKVIYDTPEKAWESLLTEYDIAAVYTNRDYEPYAKERDSKIKEMLAKQDIEFFDYKDQVIFNRDEVVKNDGDPYLVFTPYSKTWKEKLKSRMSKSVEGKEISFYLKPYPNEKYFSNLYQTSQKNIPTLDRMGFQTTDVPIPDRSAEKELIEHYDENRDYPARQGTSRLSVHFRFGTISIREKARRAQKLNETFLNELIWRDFYAMILDHYPKVVDTSFKEKYDAIDWRNNKAEFELWCNGKTGYPIVDAGMRQLNTIGYMHNRVRMITASFLTKHLLIDWRWGEAYFAEKLIDYDLASNNGGWQWAAGTGTDASPYFRVFNPTAQQKKYDKNFEYVKEWVSEYGTEDYPEPMVNHKEARERALATYKAALDKAKK